MPALVDHCSVHVERGDVATVVSVAGEVDIFGAPVLREAFADASERPQPIVLDLRDCTFFDSGGLHALLTAHLERRHHGGRVVVVCPEDSIAARMLAVSAPGEFVTHATRDDALRALAA